MPAQLLAAVATLLTFAPHGNRVDLRLDHGAAELVWLSPSTFRFRRTLDGPLPQVTSEDRTVAIQIEDSPAAVRVRSAFLEVTLQKRGLLLRVQRLNGSPLLADLTEARSSGSGVVWERQSPSGARFYGLGPRTDPEFDLRGKTLAPEVPFLVSTAGYGEFHAAPGPFRFDFTASDRYRIEAPAIDYYFYYGPTIKQIFQENKDTQGTASWPVSGDSLGSWTTLRTSLLRLVHGGMSAMRAPSFSLRAYERAPVELHARARQLGSLVDDVSAGSDGVTGFRKQLETFYGTYASEAGDKGYPLWHPLPFQFPEDAECARHADEFMLGDEMLIAPIVEPGGKRQVYLPQGLWTNLETNEVLSGRKTITVETSALPVFARNGTIVPLDSTGGMALHYFPKLGAEFFLFEADTNEWSQVHAAPAADEMRLEIEAKKTRDYEWVVHHVDRPMNVGFQDRRYTEVKTAGALTDRTWFYDAAHRNLQVRVHVAAGEDAIINLSF